MDRSKRYILALLILLSSCAYRQTAQNTVVLELNSPAVGEDGLLVEAVGVETLGGVFTPLLKKGCVTPCKSAEIWSTAQDNQSKFQVSLFRGKGQLVSGNHLLGVCYVVNIPPARRGIPQIEVTVEAAGKEIRLYAVDMATKNSMTVQCGAKPDISKEIL